MSVRVYLDMCSIQRPLDTKSQVRISVEAEAILGLLSLSESGQLVSPLELIAEVAP